MGGGRPQAVDVPGVLIAGGGAVGLMTALGLSSRGIPATVLESGEAQTRHYRASTFHPATLDLLDRYGLAEPLIEAGTVARTVQYRDWREGLIAELDLSVLAGATDHPFRVQKDQGELVEMLIQRLAARPDVRIHHGHAVRSVEQASGSAVAYVDSPDGPTRFRAAYMVGADGANSVVRRSAGIDFEGTTYPERYVTVFAHCELERAIDGLGPVAYVSDPVDWTALLRAPEHWRVLYPARADEDDGTAVSDEAISCRLAAIAGGNIDPDIEHARIYRVHMRVASRLRAGRVLLAGDAAHVNNPLGGMGLNGGLADAEALAEAIAGAMASGTHDVALDDYAERRRRFALGRVGRLSDENARAISLADPDARSAWRARMRAIAADQARSRSFLMEASLLS